MQKVPRIRSHFPLPHSAFPLNPVLTKIEIAADWLTRYTGMPLDRFGNLRVADEFSRLRAAFCSSIRLRYLRRQSPHAGRHERCRSHDHQLRHRFAKRGHDHGFAHRISSGGRVAARKMRRPEARDGNRPLHPADRRDSRRRDFGRLPVAASARLAFVQTPQIRVPKAGRARPGLSHRA